MVKIIRYPSGIPEWTKLRQEREQSVELNEAKDVEMEGIEIALEEKLVVSRGLRRKRSRTDSAFEVIENSVSKKFKVPEPREVQSEPIPAFSGMLTILIRDDKNSNETVPLHIDREKALNTNSAYISANLTSDFICDWATAIPKPIDLTNEDPSFVKHYLEWIDTHRIATRYRPRWASQEEKSKPGYKGEMTLDTEQLAHCYGLGERLEDAKYRNAIICVLRHYVVKEGCFPSDRAVAIIYENTKKGSPARKMMADFWAHAGNSTWLEDDSIQSTIWHEFLEDLVSALLRVRAKPEGSVWPWANNADAYLISNNATKTEETGAYKGKLMEL